MAKNERPKFTSPKGRFSFPKLTEPDTKFKKEGEYSVKLILSAEDAQPLIDKLEPLHVQADEEGREKYAKLPVASRKKMEAKGGGYALNPFYSPVYDRETEEETGEVEFKFNMKASGVNEKTGKAWTMKPTIYDAKGKIITKKIKIGGGTIGKVAFSAMPYFVPGSGAAGISLKMDAVQIIDLKEGFDRDASSYGFGQEEGGFEYDETTATEDSEDTDSEEQGADSSDADEF